MTSSRDCQMKLLIRWAITSFALFVAAWIVPGIHVRREGWVVFAVMVLVLGRASSHTFARSAVCQAKRLPETRSAAPRSIATRPTARNATPSTDAAARSAQNSPARRATQPELFKGVAHRPRRRYTRQLQLVQKNYTDPGQFPANTRRDDGRAPANRCACQRGYVFNPDP